MTTLTVVYNHTHTDQAYPTGTWVTMNTGSDFLIFTNGSPQVADGQAIPSSFQLSSAGIVLTGVQQTVPHYLIANVGANILNELFLMGPGNYQYVLGFVFSGATTSEPVLEAWDDISLSTTNAACLGAGTPSNSWLQGVTTTSGAPGASWIGSKLAGSSDGNFLYLNNNGGPLTGAANLYCNLKMVVPATQTAGGTNNPVLCIKFTTT